MSTIWQKGHLNVNDHTAFPVEFLQPCANAEYACTQVMLNPHHPDTSLSQVPIDYIRKIRGAGMKAFGFVWADSFSSPEDLYRFVIGWRRQSLDNGCAITGFVINAEDGWEYKDQTTGGDWSRRFLNYFRSDPATAKLSLAINTYNGCGGIALAKWQAAGARLYYQTFHEGVTHEWPIDGGVTWAKYYGFTKKALVKPNWGTYQPYPNRTEQIRAAQWARTLGFSAWYAEGAGDPASLLLPLLREARAAGVCC